MARVAVLSGGRSGEHRISLLSGEAVAGGLRDAGHEVVEVLIDRDGAWQLTGGEGEGEPGPVELRPGAGLLGADAVFPALHGPYGEDGTVQGLLEVLGVPYVGSGVLASALCMDKLSLKRLLGFEGVPQVEFVAAGEPGWRERVGELGLPVWVKPSRLGSSVGIRPVGDPAELDDAVAEAAAHDPRVIVEAAARGIEVECSVLGGEDLHLSPPGQILIEAEWYDFEAKYTAGAMELRVPAELPEGVGEQVRELAGRIFRLAGCSDLARCDFFVEPDGRVLVNEINTMPGFTPTSVYARLIEAGGIGYPELCDRLVGLALTRTAALR